MAVGPMSGLFLHDAGMSYTTIFCCSLGSCIAGLICASLVKTPYKPPVKREPISLDRLFFAERYSCRNQPAFYYPFPME